MERAHETLREAETLKSAEMWHGCVCRLHQACVFIVSAHLASIDRPSTSIAGMIVAVDELLVGRQLITAETGAVFQTLVEQSHIADLEDFVVMDAAQIDLWANQAAAFVGQVETVTRR